MTLPEKTNPLVEALRKIGHPDQRIEDLEAELAAKHQALVERTQQRNAAQEREQAQKRRGDGLEGLVRSALRQTFEFRTKQDATAWVAWQDKAEAALTPDPKEER